MALPKIVSGGQTGADRGALDAAIALGMAHGGWCPRGRRAEDGIIPVRYNVRESSSSRYEVRTEQNVIDSDGTLVVGRGHFSSGTALTIRLAQLHRKPLLCIDLAVSTIPGAVARLHEWLSIHPISVLNVAGPRESNCPGIASEVHALLVAAFAPRPTAP